MQVSDQTICLLLKKRNLKGMEYLFKKYYRPLVLWADTFLNHIPHSEDLIQDFFIKIWEKELYLSFLPETLKSYLFTSIKNQALNSAVKRDPLKLASDVKAYERKWEEYDATDEEILQKLEKAIEELPPRSREVVKRVYQRGMRYREVADELGISIATVKTLLVQSLKKIRQDTYELKKFFLYLFMKKV